MNGLLPPDAVVRECCQGLALREQWGCGGTAPSVAFAAKLCAGGVAGPEDLVNMAAALDAIEVALGSAGETARPLLVAWRLWGGDAGRDWLEQLDVPTFAAFQQGMPADRNGFGLETQPGWVVALNRTAARERDLLARIHEVLEAGVDAALSRVQSKIVNALSRPSQALRASLGGLGHRDSVLSRMREFADDAEAAIGVVPAALLAKLGPTIEEQDTLTAVFGKLTIPRVATLLAGHQQAVLDLLSDAGIPTAALAGELAENRERALRMLFDRLMRLTSERIATPNPLDDPEGELMLGKVPPSFALAVLSDAGGGDPDKLDVQDYAVTSQGLLSGAGIALGSSVLRFLSATFDQVDDPAPLLAARTVTVRARVPQMPRPRMVTMTTWRWGGSLRPFDPHVRLDGREWADEDQRRQVCGASAGTFPYVEILHPGDHRGCSCSYDVALKLLTEVPPPPAPRPTPAPAPAPAPAPVAAPATPWHGVVWTDEKSVPGTRPYTSVGAKWTARTPQGGTITMDNETPRAVHPENVARSQRMIGELQRNAPTANDRMKVRIQNMSQLGITYNDSGDVSLQADMMIDPPTRGFNTKGWNPPNAAKVTRQEYVTIHEWGHVADHAAGMLRGEAADKLSERIKAQLAPIVARLIEERGSEALSGYALDRVASSPYFMRLTVNGRPYTINQRELLAEAFADWMIDPATVAPMTAEIASFLGWAPPVVPLGLVSAAFQAAAL